MAAATMTDKIENGHYGTDEQEKGGVMQNEVLHDHDVLGNSNITREDAAHYGQLTEEEKMHEKKLKKKIDMLIMPLVMLVSCQTCRCDEIVG